MEFKRFALAMVGHFLASLLYVLRRLRLIEAVVDTSSILEHREETRDFWEKRMMADDNQSSPSSALVENSVAPCKPTEEGSEEAVVKTNSECETKHDHKMSNGIAKPIECNGTEDGDAKPAHKEEDAKANENEAQQSSAQRHVEADHDNNNCVDSLEPVSTDDYVEEKTYTSELETSLVMKQPEENATNKVEADTTQVTEQAPVAEEEKEKEAVVVESELPTPEAQSKEEEVDAAAVKVEEQILADAPEKAPEEQASSAEKDASDIDINSMSFEKIEMQEEVVTSSSIVTTTTTETTKEVLHQEEVKESATVCESQPKTLEVEKSGSDDDDGFVRVEECLPKVENTETEPESFVVVDQQDVTESSKKEITEDATSAVVEEQQVTTSCDGQDEHSAPTPPVSTPEPKSDEKASHPEIEQFVKSGGVKRILPGVQKTEQPYSTCTTETKIAMEIREMREREEELRMMREQNLLSPVVSPVPPKSPSPRSPSPAMKEGSSPSPPPGCGYRVSSVFGHKGTVSPVSPVEEEKKAFKGFSKESQVEKEIRLAREREEELRNQKGLPPREDDSYVKPSQVKSSQVRVFGKMAGTANTSVKQAATAKIQMEIEEQTQREMALRESGSIKTISQERTDAKVAKLNGNAPTNGTAHPVSNGNGYHSNGNGRASPDVAPYKRGSPSPTGGRPATIFSPQVNGKANISMHKFIASKGKETTFSAPRKEEVAPKVVPVVPPATVKLKRTVSVESKIQQEILEMKQREEELKKLHSRNGDSSHSEDEKNENEMNVKNNLLEYENGNGVHEDDLSPRHNKLIAQWESRIQKAES